MKRLALAFAVVTIFSGCETTGDPHHGGIFWSEEKAQQRLDSRQRELRRVESDTDRIERENRELRNQGDDDD